jgi:hypothetical protein
MSERTPGSGHDPWRDADEWLEHSGSSVFAPRRLRPAPPPAAPPPSAWPPPSHRPPTPTPSARQAPTRAWDAPPWAPPAAAPGAYAEPRTRTEPQPVPSRRPPARPSLEDRQARAPRPRPPGPADDGDGGPGRSPGSGLRSPVGLGAVVGLAGVAAFVAGLAVLPWFAAAGQDVTLADMRAAFTVSETDPADVVPGAGDTASTLPDDGIPTPGEITDAAEQEVRDAAGSAAAAAIDSGRSRYVELYTELLWLGVAGVVGLAVVLSTILSPRSSALSLLLGARRLAGGLTVLAALAHGAALWVVFSGDRAPSPALGVWLGIGGLGAVLVACMIGPRR